MGKIETRTFQSDSGVAVELPEALGIPVGFPVRLEWEGQTVTLRPSSDDVEKKKKSWADFLARLDEIGPVGEVGKRLPIDVPKRFGD